MSAQLFDKNGRSIEVGDIIKVFHFVGARNKRHYMYKQAIGIFRSERSPAPYLKLSHLIMDDSIAGRYLELLDGRHLPDYEIVQSIDARFEERVRAIDGVAITPEDARESCKRESARATEPKAFVPTEETK